MFVFKTVFLFSSMFFPREKKRFQCVFSAHSFFISFCVFPHRGFVSFVTSDLIEMDHDDDDNDVLLSKCKFIVFYIKLDEGDDGWCKITLYAGGNEAFMFWNMIEYVFFFLFFLCFMSGKSYVGLAHGKGKNYWSWKPDSFEPIAPSFCVFHISWSCARNRRGKEVFFPFSFFFFKLFSLSLLNFPFLWMTRSKRLDETNWCHGDKGGVWEGGKINSVFLILRMRRGEKGKREKYVNKK